LYITFGIRQVLYYLYTNGRGNVALTTTLSLMRRNRINDNYAGKITFWTEQLGRALILGDSARYSEERCSESLAYFKRRASENESSNSHNS